MNYCFHFPSAPNRMTDPKNPENQSEELSLDHLKDAAGGYCEIELTVEEFKDSKPRRSSIANQNNLLSGADPGGDNI